MKLFLITFLFSILYISSYADNIITGNTSVTPNSIETYTANWNSWGSVYENYASVSWTVTNGTILSSDKHTVTIQWDDIPTWMNAVGVIDVYEDLGGQSGELILNIVNFVEGVSESCNGILGPAAIAEDFGSGNNPGPALPPGQITYTYNPNCAIVSGEYTRTNTTVNCRGPWLGLSQDHTPNDINGYMLLIDGDDRRGEVYRGTANNLTDAFEYEFSVWVANLANSSSYQVPRINFEIWDNANNLILQSGSYAIQYISDPALAWQKIAFMVSLPSGVTSVQVVLVNQNNDPGGNDFVVDDIAFAPCYPPIIGSFANNPSVQLKALTCDNGTVTLFSWWATPTIPFANPAFKWQRSNDLGANWADISGATSMNFVQTENTAGIYLYRIMAYETSNPSQFFYSNTLTYYVQKMVVNATTFNVIGCTSETVELNPTFTLQYSDPNATNLTYTFNWSPSSYLSSTTIQNPTITLPQLPPPNPPNSPNPPPPVNYNYTLTIQNSNYGCTGSNTQIVAHQNPRPVYLYNAFTPDGDGLNDYFRPVNIQDYNLFGAEFKIYNRWGQLIFQKNSGTTLLDWSWDGTINGLPQASGNFVYTLKIPGCPENYVACPNCNVDYNSSALMISGNFVLIR